MDDLWGQAVQQRDGNKCAKCGSTVYLCGHHIHTKKAYPAGRWLIENGITLCRTCHLFAHHYPEEFRYWLIGRCGGECMLRLLLYKVRQVYQYRRSDYIDEYTRLSNAIENKKYGEILWNTVSIRG